MTLYSDLFYYRGLDETLSDESCVRAILRFEAALAMALGRTGTIPNEAAAVIAERCARATLDLSRIAKEAAHAGNVAIPIIKLLTEEVARQDPEAARYVHWGATSQDAIDTGFLLQLREALRLVERDLARLTATLTALAKSHRATLMVGRTWMQQALPTTLGFVAAGWLDSILDHRKRLAEMRPRILSLQFGGAVGTLAALRGRGFDLGQTLAAELQLTFPDVPWHTERDRLAEMAAFFGVFTGALGKIARDISLYAQTEVAELVEPARAGRGGSSTLPHKRNPVTSAVVLAAATRVPGLVATMLSAMPQEYQRGLGSWHAEWETLPQIVRLGGGALHHLTEMMPHLEVDTKQMRQNLDRTNGLIFAEAATMAIAARVGKAQAHEWLEKACRKCREERRHLKEVLGGDPALRSLLSSSDLDGLFEATNYLGNAGEFVDRIVTRASQFDDGI